MTPTADTPDANEPPARLVPLTLAAAVLTWLADFLFWKSMPGANVSIFFFVLTVAILATRGRAALGRWTWLVVLLLLGACAQAAIDLCLTNTCVLIALLAILAGGTFYTHLPAGWPRWVEQLGAFALCVTRLPWLVGTWLRGRAQDRPLNPAENAARWLLIALPALVLVAVFGSLLGEGNAIFGDYAKRALNAVADWFRNLDFTAMRLFFWLLAASFVLACLRPHLRPLHPRSLTREPDWWMRVDEDFARKQSIVALLALNVLFLAANSVDVVFLWMHRSIPDDVNARDYIHAGVNNLIVATVLAAVVLAFIFQQQPAVSRSRALRVLAQLWIVQNCVLAAGVYLRDWLYVEETHLLTEKRIYVACFLALVLVGYVFLAIHVQRGSGIGTLFRRNAAAAFALFYVMQFLDVGGFAANWCARKAVAEPDWGFDLGYWSTQGTSAWPALAMVAHGPRHANGAGAAAAVRLAKLRESESKRSLPDWRTWQWRIERQRQSVAGE